MEEKTEKKGLFSNFKFFQKLRSIKHIEIVIAVVLAAVVLLIYFSTFKTSSKGETTQTTSVSEYAAMIESKLSNIISKIDGVGNVSVMVTLASGPEYVYATNDE